jgi:hypothetical protein
MWIFNELYYFMCTTYARKANVCSLYGLKWNVFWTRWTIFHESFCPTGFLNPSVLRIKTVLNSINMSYPLLWIIFSSLIIIIIIIFHSHISFTFLLNYVLGIIPSEPSQTKKPLVSPSTFSFIKPPLPDTVQLFVPLPEKLPIRELHWLFKHAIPVSSAISHQAPRNQEAIKL